MAGRTPTENAQTNSLAAAMKAVRTARRLRASEVARAMDMPLRTYEHFESGRGRISYDRLMRFAAATESDPIALVSAMILEAPDLAVRCCDNKMMLVIMVAIGDLNDDLGPDLVYLETGTVIGAITRVCKELSQHVRKRDTFAETWLNERTRRAAGAADPARFANPKKSTT